jgi:hypothetical protein
MRFAFTDFGFSFAAIAVFMTLCVFALSSCSRSRGRRVSH